MATATIERRQSRKGILSSDADDDEVYFGFSQPVSQADWASATFVKLKFELEKLGEPGSEQFVAGLTDFIAVDHLKGFGSWVRAFCLMQTPPVNLGFIVQKSGNKGVIARSVIRALNMLCAFNAATDLIPVDAAGLEVLDDGLFGRINTEAARHATLLKLINASCFSSSILLLSRRTNLLNFFFSPSRRQPSFRVLIALFHFFSKRERDHRPIQTLCAQNL